MDKDRIEGTTQQKGGKVKEKLGKALDDEKLKREGQTDQIKGKVKNTVGGLKDELREHEDRKH